MHADAPPTAGEALLQLQSTLRNLAGPSGLGIVPDSPEPKQQKTGTSAATRDYDIHKLSAISLSRTRRDVALALDSLKSSTAARESWQQAFAERLIRVRSDTELKLRTTKASKAALTLCRRIALTEDPFATKSVQAVHHLHAIADEAGATTWRDDQTNPAGHPRCELNVSGTRFIADFLFPDLTASSVNVEVSFRFLTDANVERPDDAIGQSFASLLRDQCFDDLRSAFESLMGLEKLSTMIRADSLCDALRAFEDDLLNVQECERKSNMSDDDRMCHGHGQVERTACGLRVTFAPSHHITVGLEYAMRARNISMAQCPLVPRQAVVASSTPPFPIFEFGDCRMATLPAQYVLTLNKRIFVSLSVAQALDRVASGDDGVKAALRVGSARGASACDLYVGRESRSEHGERRGYWPSLQCLLAPQVFSSDNSEKGDGQSQPRGQDGNAADNAGDEENGKLAIEQSHWSQQASEYVALAALPGDQYVQFSHSGCDMVAALALHRVPVCHPKHVGPVLAVLRQQVTFNKLFRSCFGSPIPMTTSLRPLLRQAVEVVVCDSPSFLQFSFFDAVVNDILSMGVSVDVGGDVNVVLKATSGQPHMCSDCKATLCLRRCLDIPLTIRAIQSFAGRSSAS